MNTKKYLLVAFLALLMLSSRAFADISSTDLYELNNATPGTAKVNVNAGTNSGVGLGNALKGTFINQVYGLAGGIGGVALGNVDANSATTTVSGYRLVLWRVPVSGYSISLGNGTPGQRITIIKMNSGTTAGKVTPVTKSGFTDATLTNAGEGVTFQYIDDTIGWIPQGFFGNSTSVIPKITP